MYSVTWYDALVSCLVTVKLPVYQLQISTVAT